MRRIENDAELLVVAKVFLAEIAKGLKDGKCLVFFPDNIKIPEKREIKRKTSFSYAGETQNIPVSECFRLLGVTLYHLAKGQSEYTHEAYHADPVDAYLNLSFESKLWPAIFMMLEGNVEKVSQVKKALPTNQKKIVNTADDNTSSKTDDIIYLSRSGDSGLPNTTKFLYPKLQEDGPNEYNIDQLDEWYHPDQASGKVTGHDIHEYLKTSDLLWRQLGIADLEAIRAKGPDFFRKHFAGKRIFAWKSILEDTNGFLVVPYLYQSQDSGNLSIIVIALASDWRSSSAGLSFKQSAINQPREDRVEPETSGSKIIIDTDIEAAIRATMGKNCFLSNEWWRFYNINMTGVLSATLPPKFNIESFFDLLSSPCPIENPDCEPEKPLICQTHFLLLAPKKFFTLLTWRDRHPENTQPRFQNGYFLHWFNDDNFAMNTKNRHALYLGYKLPLPGSFDKSYPKQLNLLPKTHEPFLTVELAMFLLCYYKRNNVMLYPGMGGRCQDNSDSGDDWPVYIYGDKSNMGIIHINGAPETNVSATLGISAMYKLY